MIGEVEARIPDLAEPILAWRCFKIGGTGDPFILTSPSQPTTWPPIGGTEVFKKDYITANCRAELPTIHPCPSPPDMKAGHPGMGCGIYGYKNIEDLAWDWPLRGMSVREDRTCGPQQMFWVWGRVHLWGEVYEHDRGYRAEFSRVHTLAYVEGRGAMSLELVEEVAEDYGIGVEIFDQEMVEFLREMVQWRADGDRPKKEKIVSFWDTLAITAGVAYDRLRSVFYRR